MNDRARTRSCQPRTAFARRARFVARRIPNAAHGNASVAGVATRIHIDRSHSSCGARPRGSQRSPRHSSNWCVPCARRHSSSARRIRRSVPTVDRSTAAGRSMNSWRVNRLAHRKPRLMGTRVLGKRSYPRPLICGPHHRPPMTTSLRMSRTSSCRIRTTSRAMPWMTMTPLRHQLPLGRLLRHVDAAHGRASRSFSRRIPISITAAPVAVYGFMTALATNRRVPAGGRTRRHARTFKIAPGLARTR